MPAIKRCWYCDHFEASMNGSNQGECRRTAPTGLSSQLIPKLGDKTKIFAQIFDATIEWCGDFKPSTGVVADPI